MVHIQHRDLPDCTAAYKHGLPIPSTQLHFHVKDQLTSTHTWTQSYTHPVNTNSKHLIDVKYHSVFMPDVPRLCIQCLMSRFII